MRAPTATISANRPNSLPSASPMTAAARVPAAKSSSQHGLTGEGVALPNEPAAEVERRFAAYREELKPAGELGETLVRRAALLSIRLDRCVSYETASLRRRIRQAEADFVAPAGVDAATLEQLKAEARALAMFDPTPEGNLARRHEAATERSFHRALKELHRLERSARMASARSSEAVVEQTLASFLQWQKDDDAMDARFPELNPKNPLSPTKRFESVDLSPVDVPFTIGRRR